ncbi:MAG: class I tRNA ligase family protein, partial [Rudaea sp.]
RGRRSAQSAMYRILEALVRWIAPVLSFTAEEIWQQMPGKRDESVLFETWYAGLQPLQQLPQQRHFWEVLLDLRAASTKTIEIYRRNTPGFDGSSLSTKLTLGVSDAHLALLSPFKGELAFFFIVSEVDLKPLSKVGHMTPECTFSVAGESVFVLPWPKHGQKCIRCWHYEPELNPIVLGEAFDTSRAHPEICDRCVSNLPGNRGEDRRYF